MNTKECIDIINAIIKKMNCTGFLFVVNSDPVFVVNSDLVYGNYICFKMILKENYLYEKRHYREYAAWETIDDMFFNFADIYSFIELDKKNIEDNMWGYDVINENGFKFLEILSKCSSIKEFMMKMQLMGLLI